MSPSKSKSAVADRSTDDVYGRLSRMIVRLEIEPGALISEATLLRRLDTDRAELRGALKRLEQARLISVIPRVGLVIAPLGFREIKTVYEARFGLEGYVARLAAGRATVSEVQELGELVAALHTAGSRAQQDQLDAAVEFVERDFLVHAALSRMARNPILDEAMQSILVSSSRVWNAFYQYAQAGESENYFTSHDDLLEAVSKHDADAAEAAVQHHLNISWALIRAAFDGIPGAG
jgi:DNA-binding GntR family transcriptional regulator